MKSDENYDSEYFESRYEDLKYGVNAEARRAYLYKARSKILSKLISCPRLILEVGCGVGYMTKWLKKLKNNNSVIAIDFSFEATTKSRNNLRNIDNVEVLQADACSLPLKDNSVDLVVAYDVVEHLANPQQFFSEASRVLKENGFLMFSTPNMQSFGRKMKNKIEDIKHINYDDKWLWFGYRDATHVSILKKSEWKKIALQNNFLIIDYGTDYLWDAPYFKFIPSMLQEILFKLVHRILTHIRYYQKWSYGENFIAICKKTNRILE